MLRFDVGGNEPEVAFRDVETRVSEYLLKRQNVPAFPQVLRREEVAKRVG